MGLLVEGWSTDSGESVAGSFQNPTSLSPQCETMLSLLGGFKGVKEQHLEEGREAWGGVGAFVWLGTPSSLPSCFHCLCVFRLELAGGFPGRRLSLRVLAPPPATPSWGGCLAETKHSLRCPAPTASALSLAAGLPLVAAEPETQGSGAGRQWDREWSRRHSTQDSAPFCYLRYL